VGTRLDVGREIGCHMSTDSGGTPADVVSAPGPRLSRGDDRAA
jgi:hypothetical protein